MRALALDRQALSALDALRAAGVDALLIKGPALAAQLYRDGEPRAYQDVDVIVDPRRWEGARTALAQLGFACTLALAEMAPPHDDHAEHWRKGGAAGDVDLHLELPGVAVSPPAAWDELWAGRGTVEVAGRTVPTLGPAGTALLVALHLTSHAVRAAKPLRDLELALRHLPPSTWSEAASLATKLEAGDRFALGLAGVPEGAALAQRLGLAARPSAALRLRVDDASPAARTIAAVAEAPTWRARAQVINHKVFPTPAYMREYFPLATRGRSGLALSYVLRWARMIPKAPAALLTWQRSRRQSATATPAPAPDRPADPAGESAGEPADGPGLKK